MDKMGDGGYVIESLCEVCDWRELYRPFLNIYKDHILDVAFDSAPYANIYLDFGPTNLNYTYMSK